MRGAGAHSGVPRAVLHTDRKTANGNRAASGPANFQHLLAALVSLRYSLRSLGGVAGRGSAGEQPGHRGGGHYFAFIMQMSHHYCDIDHLASAAWFKFRARTNAAKKTRREITDALKERNAFHNYQRDINNDYLNQILAHTTEAERPEIEEIVNDLHTYINTDMSMARAMSESMSERMHSPRSRQMYRTNDGKRPKKEIRGELRDRINFHNVRKRRIREYLNEIRDKFPELAERANIDKIKYSILAGLKLIQ